MKVYLVIFAFLCIETKLFCAPCLLQPKNLAAQSAIVIDVQTGDVLFEKDADKVIPPASLTKIMTLYLAYQAMQEGRINLETPVFVSHRADYRSQEPGSSVMFLEENQTPVIYDLLLGLAIASGNDAAVALAENLSGTVENFVAQMNQQAAEWGLEHTHFVDPAGISENNYITAKEYAIIAQHYLNTFPKALKDLHNVPFFIYPRRENWATNGHQWHYTFQNKTPLLNEYRGADGLKTGYIQESGYNFVSTAKWGRARLIGVALGIQAPGRQTGDQLRTSDMAKMLNYGFMYIDLLNSTKEMPKETVFLQKLKQIKECFLYFLEKMRRLNP